MATDCLTSPSTSGFASRGWTNFNRHVYTLQAWREAKQTRSKALTFACFFTFLVASWTPHPNSWRPGRTDPPSGALVPLPSRMASARVRAPVSHLGLSFISKGSPTESDRSMPWRGRGAKPGTSSQTWMLNWDAACAHTVKESGNTPRRFVLSNGQTWRRVEA